MNRRFSWTERVTTGWNGTGEWATPIVREDPMTGVLLQFVVLDGTILNALMLDDKTGTVFRVAFNEITVMPEAHRSLLGIG